MNARFPLHQYPFQRLQLQLSEIIASLPAESRLPSEPNLARQLGVSRATLREAMRSFESRGLIRRRQGVGTFIVGQSQVLEGGLEILESIETLAHRIGLTVSMGALQVEQLKADPITARLMDVEAGRPLIRVARVIKTDGHPAAYLVDTLPHEMLSPEELDSSTFTGSVLDLLLKRGTPPLGTSRTEICASHATPEVARSLQVQRGDVLLQFIARLYAVSGGIVAYSLSYFIPGYFRFHVNRRVCHAVPGEQC